MQFLVILFFFGLGSILASFIGLVVGRLYTGESILSGRSKCDVCGSVLSASVLLPIVSLLASGGRAQCCGARISLFSSLTEIILGIFFVVAYLTFGVTFVLLAFLTALVLIAGIVLYDLRHFIIPPVFLWPFVLVSVLFSWLHEPALFLQSSYIALLIGGFLAALHFLSRGRAMGLADAPFAFGLALLAGPLALSGIFYSFLFGAVVGIVILVNAPRGHKMGIEVPFAPYLAAGSLFALCTHWDALELMTSFLNHIIG